MNQKINDIAFISKPIIPPWNDGTKVLIRNLIYGLTKFNYLIVSSDIYRIIKKNVTNVPLAKGNYPTFVYKTKLFFYFTLKKRAKIYCYFFAPTPYNVYVSKTINRIAETRSVQVIPSQPLSWRHKEEIIFGDKIIVLSRYSYRKVLSLGIKKEDVKIIPPPLLPTYEDLEKRAKEIRHRLSIEKDQFVILYPGDLEFSGAIWNVLKASVEILRNYKAIFVFASRPKTDEARTIQEIVEKETYAYGIADRCRFVGEVPDIKGLIKGADLCILPAETTYAKLDYPLVLLEAMEQGIPIIVGKGTPAEELTKLHNCGIAVDPFNSFELVEAISKFLENKELRKEMGERGKEAIKSCYTPDKIGEMYENVFKELLE